MAVSLSIFPLTPPSLFLVFFSVSFSQPCLFLSHSLPTLSLFQSCSLSHTVSPTLISFSLFHRVYLSRTLSICSSLSPTVHTVCHSFISLSLLPLSFLLFFPLWLSLSPNVTVFLSYSLSLFQPVSLSIILSPTMSLFLSFSLYVAHSLFLPPQTQSLYLSLTLSPTLFLFVSFSLSHPTSTFFSLSVALLLSPNMFLFLFFLSVYLALSHSQPFLCFNLSLSPTPISLSLSLSLPPCFFLSPTPVSFSTSHPVSFPHCLSFYLSLSPTVSLSILLPPPHCLFLFHHASLSLSSSEALSQREGKIETG